MTVVIDGTTGIDTGTGSLVAASSATATYLDLFEDTDNGSNYVRLIAPTSVASNRTITLPDGTGTVAVNGVSGVLVSGTAITLTTQTAPEFTSIPSWAKRITLMFQGVNTNGTANYQIQLGTSGGFVISGYLGASADGPALTATAFTTGFGIRTASAAAIVHGSVSITNVSGNAWCASGALARSDGATFIVTAGSIALSGTLDRLRIIGSATGSPSDIFDAGTINILYE